jgi:hypothetical protein
MYRRFSRSRTEPVQNSADGISDFKMNEMKDSNRQRARGVSLAEPAFQTGVQFDLPNFPAIFF